VRGIDVSHHQGVIDWKKIKTQNIHFVYIKATEGGDFTDKKFQTNWSQAIKSGIIPGAYHFFNFCTSPVKQAKHFIKTVPNIPNSLPPVIDIEFIGYCKIKPSVQQYKQSVTTFITLLHKHYKKSPVIYTTYGSYKGYLDTLFLKQRLWMRDVYWAPHFKQKRDWQIWQYSNRGHLKGIKTFVDLNVFNGTRKEFQTFIKQ